MVKVACGLYFAVGAKDNRRISETHTIDLTKIWPGVFRSGLGFSRAGLYFLGDVGTRVNVQDVVEMSPLSLDSEHRFCGARISLHGYAFDCLFDTTGANSGNWTGLMQRPSEFVLKRKQREHPHNCNVAAWKSRTIYNSPGNLTRRKANAVRSKCRHT